MDIPSARMPDRRVKQSQQPETPGLSAPVADAIDWSDHFAQAAQTSILICTGDDSAPLAASQIPAMAQAAGHRVLDVLPIHISAEYLSGLIALDAVILSCSGAEPGLDALLARLDSMAETGSISLLIMTNLSGLDGVHALVHSRSTVIICEPEPFDIAAALTALGRHRAHEVQLHDIGKDNEAEASRFDILSDQLFKLNTMIEALVQSKTAEESPDGLWEHPANTLKSPGRSYSAEAQDEAFSAYTVQAHQVRALLRSRRLREQILSPDLFADPAWDILLDLMAARLENTRVSVSSLCIAAAVPPTTALRWIRQLTDRGLLERQADPRDGRRIFIGLSEAGYTAVTHWFQQSQVHFLAALQPAPAG